MPAETETFGQWLTTWPPPAEVPDGSWWEWEVHRRKSDGTPITVTRRVTWCNGHLVDANGLEWLLEEVMDGDRLRRVYPTGTAQGRTPETTCSSPFQRWEGWLGSLPVEGVVGIGKADKDSRFYHRDGEYACAMWMNGVAILRYVLSAGRMWTGEEGV